VIFLGGQRGRITSSACAVGRIQYVSQPPLFAPSVKYCAVIEYADRRTRSFVEACGSLRAARQVRSMLNTAHVIKKIWTCRSGCRPKRIASPSRDASASAVESAVKLLRAPGSPFYWLTWCTLRRAQKFVESSRTAWLRSDPDVRRYVLHQGPRALYFPVRLLPPRRSTGCNVCLCIGSAQSFASPVHYGKAVTGRQMIPTQMDPD